MSLEADLMTLTNNLSQQLDDKRKRRLELDVEIRELQGMVSTLELILDVNSREKEKK